MKFTRKGYGQLRRADDTVVSQHTVPEEAYERAVMGDLVPNGIGGATMTVGVSESGGTLHTAS